MRADANVAIFGAIFGKWRDPAKLLVRQGPHPTLAARGPPSPAKREKEPQRPGSASSYAIIARAAPRSSPSASSALATMRAGVEAGLGQHHLRLVVLEIDVRQHHRCGT